MKTLILTEKPSVAKDFAKALGVTEKKEGAIVGGDFAITWAVGHLVELFKPEDYDSRFKKWAIEDLPILPDTMRYKALPKTKGQLAVIKKLLKDKSFTRVVIATDAGREGEVIARTILDVAGFNDPEKLYRFWTSQALTAEVVAAGLESVKPAGDFDRLWQAGKARQIADWLVGMNGSRAATLKLRCAGESEVFSVGRVQTAVLSLLVDRRREREAFTPKPYWLLRCLLEKDKDTWWGTWFNAAGNRFEAESDAKAMMEKVLDKIGLVSSVKREKKKEPPPLLYSLTVLQQDANRKHGFSAKKTLDIAQALYEKHKCLSYPRTDSRVLGTRNVEMVASVIEKLSPANEKLFHGVAPELVSVSNKRVFNDAKLTDHHALIPLAACPQDATEDEKKIFDLVLRRFAAAFHPDCEYEQTEIITEVEGETFRTNGKTILVSGWREVYSKEGTLREEEKESDEENEENLPLVTKGDQAEAKEAKIDARKTTPPPEYTEALLLKDMTNPSRYVEEKTLKDLFRGEVGLGTQATRAAIIETLVERNYVERQKKTLAATAKGCLLIHELRKLPAASALTTPRETGKWERRLEEIAQGAAEGGFIDGIKDFVNSLVEEIKALDLPENGSSGVIATCPACGGEIVPGMKGYGCSNWRPEDGGCKFVIWKEMAGRKISPQEAAALIEGKVLGPFEFTSKKNKSFTAGLKLNETDGKFTVIFLFEDTRQKEEGAKEIGKCPSCGGSIFENPKSYGCSNWRAEDGGCRFVVWKEMAGRKISSKEAAALMAGEILGPFEFTSRKKKGFTASLKLDETKKVTFDYAN